MKAATELNFKWIYRVLTALLFVMLAARCLLVPFSHDEVATFFYYIQPGSFIPFHAHPDANGHFLTSALGWLCFKLFGSSVFSLRLPTLLAFLVLAYAVYRLLKFTRSIHAKVLLLSGFLLSFNFLGFYALARGYGISMSFLLLALCYLFEFQNAFRARHAYKFLLFSQVALAANLTLIFVVALATFFLMLLQLRKRAFFSAANVLFLVLHFALIYFWVRYAFYLRDAGALYYGGGESYWEVTFVTLMETILVKSRFVSIAVVLLFLFMAARWVLLLLRKKADFLAGDGFALSFLMLVTLIASFYLLHTLLGVNYPEDRTGLFFYVFFMVSLAFMTNSLNPRAQLVFYAIPLVLVSHFVMNLNFRVHCWPIYETFPASFHERLIKEQANAGRRITVGGHRVREFIYGFFNYNGAEKLNHMTAPEALEMSADYAVAYAADEPYYKRWYDEIAREDDWGFSLIRRKQPASRNLVFSAAGRQQAGTQEYCNFIEVADTSFTSTNPLYVEADLSIGEAPLPFNAWLVLQVDAADDPAANVFVRVPLNLLRYDWNGKRQTVGLLSGIVPQKVKRLVVYLWNIEQAQADITINKIEVFQLAGDGVAEVSKAKI